MTGAEEPGNRGQLDFTTLGRDEDNDREEDVYQFTASELKSLNWNLRGTLIYVVRLRSGNADIFESIQTQTASVHHEGQKS